MTSEFTITLNQVPAPQDEKIGSAWRAPITRVIGTLDFDSDSSDSDSDTERESANEKTPQPYTSLRRRCICCGPRVLRIPPSPTTSPPPPPLRTRTRRTTIRPMPSTTHIAQSRISATLRPVPTLEHDTTLLILTLSLNPAAGCRFINAIITWSFRTLNSASGAPRVLGIAPQHSVGAWTPAQVGAIRGSALETEKMQAMRIEGSVRGSVSRCVWTVEENTSNRSGVPARLQLVAALAHEGAEEVGLELDVRSELHYAGGSVPVGGAVARVVDVSQDADAGEGERVEWRAFLKGVTGRVDVSGGEA